MKARPDYAMRRDAAEGYCERQALPETHLGYHLTRTRTGTESTVSSRMEAPIRLNTACWTIAASNPPERSREQTLVVLRDFVTK
jgi:hypothetical protein